MNMNVESARLQMVEQQVRAWEVLDLRVLEVMSAIPREEFVPEAYRSVAFADTSIPLPHGQSLLPDNLTRSRPNRGSIVARSVRSLHGRDKL